tara:strand:+ start:1944 stop:2750 length:807 start_codon:yes stop_codon:yes gene_type:complete
MENKDKILQVDHLNLHFKLSRGFFKSPILIKAVNNISFSLFSGETLGIVGESGSGKSSLCRLILKLVNKTSGSISWFNNDIDSLNSSGLKNFRKSVQIIFQDPYGSLDPRMTIGKIISEPLDIYRKNLKTIEKEELVILAMKDVGLSNELFNRYPHELSGGQCQRVGIARSLINKPSVLICDEPVSALDLSIQAQILDLIKILKSKYKLTIIFVSHDLSIIKSICDRVIVLKDGNIIESNSTINLFKNPQSVYTKKLISSVPSPIPLD